MRVRIFIGMRVRNDLGITIRLIQPATAESATRRQKRGVTFHAYYFTSPIPQKSPKKSGASLFSMEWA